jgi:multidrug transporter EmrE-like cation transporter
MTASSFALLMVGVLLNATAQLLLKAGTNAIGAFEFSLSNIVPIGIRIAGEWHILGGLACYVASVVIWILALSRVEVSIAYPMLSVGYIINAIAAWYLLGESLSLMRLSGIGIIMLGCYVVARS